MQIKLFSIPIIGDENDTLTNELNSFLRSHRILNVERHLVTTSNSGLWCFCVEYVDGSTISNARQGGKKIDYKEALSKEEFAKFSFLRECRKALATELGVPAYAIFVDAELAELSKTELEKINKETMIKMEGFGEKRFENYGSKFVDFLKAKLNEKSGQPVSENS